MPEQKKDSYYPDKDVKYTMDEKKSLKGVYNVNKGYYRFQRIERLRQNSEYVIIKKNTPDGVRRYDHIAMNSEDAVDSAIISDIR